MKIYLKNLLDRLLGIQAVRKDMMAQARTIEYLINENKIRFKQIEHAQATAERNRQLINELKALLIDSQLKAKIS